MEGLLEFLFAELIVIAAEDEHVRLLDQGERLAKIRSGGDVHATGRLEGHGIGAEEELWKVMGTAGPYKQHTQGIIRLGFGELLPHRFDAVRRQGEDRRGCKQGEQGELEDGFFHGSDWFQWIGCGAGGSPGIQQT
jgi:hypothetical protein